MCCWIQRGRQSTEDEHRSGRPADMLRWQRSISPGHDTVRKATGYQIHSWQSEDVIRHNPSVLGYHKVCARWVPRMLTPENKQARLTTSHDYLSRYTYSSLLTFRRETKSHLFRQSHDWLCAVYCNGQQTSALSCATVLDDVDFVKCPTTMWWQHSNTWHV